MQIRTELAIGITIAVMLGVGAAALGARNAHTDDSDQRRSTFLAGPSGALGYAQALERLGVRVERLRRPPEELGRMLDDDSTFVTEPLSGAPPELRRLLQDSAGVEPPRRPPTGFGRMRHDSARTVVAVLGPTIGLSVAEASALVQTPVDLLVAGDGASAVLRCLGYRLRPLKRPAADTGKTGQRAVLVRTPKRSIVDSSDAEEDGVSVTCTGPAPVTIDTLLRVPAGALALRLTYDSGRVATLVADDELFSNRALRATDAGPFALGLIVPAYQRVIVDEYHQGFETGGSLAGALFAWSRRSPWGWAAWQLAVVGVLALLAAGVRFGPVRTVIDRRRRSPLEHVRALATALAAARGHGVAVSLLVRGLRRRLSRTGQSGREDPRAWLDELAREDVVRTADGRRALDVLRDLTGRAAGTDDVRRAANAVEDVWEALTNSPPNAWAASTTTPTRSPLTPPPPARS